MEIWQFNENKIKALTELKTLPADKLIWIQADPQEVLSTLQEVESLTNLTIHERHIKDCLNLQHPCFYDSTQGYDILIFRSLVPSSVGSFTDTKPIVFLLFNNLLVTFDSYDNAMSRIKTRLESTRKKLPADPMSLSFLLLDEIIDNFLDLRGPLLERFAYWQQELFSESGKPLKWIDFLKFKTEIRKFRILSEDQQEVIYQWRQDNEMALNEHNIVRFNDLHDHIHRIIRYTTQLENDLDTLVELHYSLIGNRTNEVMKILTVLSAIFLPLNLVAGIFGMNFTNMRLLQFEYGAHIAILSMVLIGIILFSVFKWKRWI